MTKGEINFKSVRKKCKGDKPYENEFKKIGEGKVERATKRKGKEVRVNGKEGKKRQREKRKKGMQGK